MFSRFGSSELTYQQNVHGSGGNNKILIGDSAIKQLNDTALQTVMNTFGKTASKVIESGGDIVNAPVVWLKDMQKNWLAYMVVTAIILSSIAVLYCAISSYFNRKKNNGFNNNLLEIVKIFNNKTGILQQPLPLSVSNLPSNASQGMV
jgi:hypothetical protein